ncbi:MAG TPA: DUF4234 domain-containing protein [Blastocatellia bacterium]|nr:DUF4234 domain-containing protein [Blastocatellia bacterium]
MADEMTGAQYNAGPIGKRRDPALVALLMVVTCNVYWLYWIYRTYKEVRDHNSAATRIIPGEALGFVFIPLFNFFWFFRVWWDCPRAILRLQRGDPMGERLLSPAAITTLMYTGFLLNVTLAIIHPGLLVVTEAMIVYAVIDCQRALNAHWQRHSPAGAAPASVEQGETFAAMLGIWRDTIQWGRVATFPAALIFSGVVVFVASQVGRLLVRMLFEERGSMSGMVEFSWMMRVSLYIGISEVILGLLAWALVWALRNEIGAAFIVAAFYAPLGIPLRFVSFSLFSESAMTFQFDAGLAVNVVYRFVWSLVLLVGLALSVRWIRPRFLALWLPAALAEATAGTVSEFLFAVVRGQNLLDLVINTDPFGGRIKYVFERFMERLIDYGGEIVTALLFAGLMTMGLLLFPLREKSQVPTAAK